MNYKQTLIFSGILVVVLGMAIFAYMFLHDYQVLNKGQILPYTDGYIYEILIAGKYKIYIEPEIRLRSDVFTAAILLGVAYISMTFASILYLREKSRISQRVLFCSIMSVGMFYLAADELLGIHESIGHNLQFLMSLPGLSHPDDLVIAAYGIGALVFLCCFRSVLAEMRRSLRYFVLALVFFVVAAISDLATLGFIEEIAELVSGILILVGIVSFGLESLQKSEISHQVKETR
ncbi:MAG: hypothetical protein ACYTEU_13065 [Planctomycetota bacterium]|jgi:hypothetical protein